MQHTKEQLKELWKTRHKRKRDVPYEYTPEELAGSCLTHLETYAESSIIQLVDGWDSKLWQKVLKIIKEVK